MSEPTSESSPSPAPSASGGVRVRIFGRTDVGMVREHNEDNFLIADLTANQRSVRPEVRNHVVGPRGTLFAVCDGMGGAAAGEVASQMAVDTIYDLLQSGPPPTNRDQFAQRLSAAINEAGARIFLAAKSDRKHRGMGTTSTVAGVFDRTLFLGQVGDSRGYLVRQGRIKQLTKDQSLVSKLIESGQLTEAEAESYEHSHIILQALGTSDTVSVDLSFMDLRQGDAVLLCSDGLSGLVSAEQMREVLMAFEDPIECCKRLTDLANAAGGHDNVTVIVARFDGELPPVTPDDEIFGYQPYVVTEPIEPSPAARVSGRIKDAEMPPPGRDVKYAVSMRPPAGNALGPSAAASAPFHAASPSLENLGITPRASSRTVIAVVLIVAALAVLGVALALARGRRAQAPEPSPSATVPANTSARAAQVPAGQPQAPAVATAIAPPSGWSAGTDATVPPADGAAAPSPTAAPGK